MTRSPQRQFDTSILAILHRTGAVWRAVVVKLPNGGRSDGGGKSGNPRLLAHKSFSEPRAGDVDHWLDQHDVGSVISVLHAPSVICRTSQLPDAPVEQLGPALRLQAEAHLFGIAPPHRLGMAVLESAPGESSRSGIILAWPESAKVDHPPTNRPVRYAPDVAGLASLLDGLRPAAPIAWIDRHDGSLALAVAHAGGAVFRGLREDASDEDTWKNSIGRVLAETSLSVGHTAAFVESMVASTKNAMSAIPQDGAQLLAPAEVIQRASERLDGSTTDAQWWAEYGIAASVAIAHTSALAPLTQLRESAPIEKQTPLTTVIAALSTRRAAVITVAACILLLMFGPFVFNGLRLAILSTKHPEDVRHTQLARINSIRNQIAMYRELDRNSWSTTKILADIVSNTPEGIELEFIRINPQRSFAVRGRAIRHNNRSATEVIGLMRLLLNESGIFHDASLNWREPDAYGSYQFDLSAAMVRPFRRFEYPEDLDFSEWSLADRMRGLRPSERDAQAEMAAARSGDEVTRTVADLIGVELTEEGDDDELEMADAAGDEWWDDEDEVIDERRARAGSPDFGRVGGASDGRGAGSVTNRTDGPTSSAVHDIPPAMTREQIELMTEPEVRDTLNRVAAAREVARTRRDQELQDRLRQEFEWLMDRVRSFQ